MPSPRTVRIDLLSGDVIGLRRAAVTTSTLAVYDVPRAIVGEFLQRPEADQPAALILFDDDGRIAQTPVRVLSCPQIGDQLMAYQRSDPNWNRALIVLSTTNSFTDVHFKVLLQLMRREGSVRLCREPSCLLEECERPVHERMKAECAEALILIRLVLETLGYGVVRTAQDPAAAALAK